MNKFKRISAAALAAALMTGTALTVNAEESQPKLLIAEDFPTAANLYGGGYGSNSDGFFKLGEEEFAKWRETGKLEVTSVESEVDITDLEWWNGSFEGEYLQLAKKDADGNITERKVVHLDKENNKIELAYTLGADWCYTTPDGYTVLEPTSDVENGTITVTAMKPDGTTFTNTINGCVAHMDGAQWDDYVWYTYRAVSDSDSKYCCYVVVVEKLKGSWIDNKIYTVYGIGKDGTTTKIGVSDMYSCGSIEYCDSERVIVSYDDGVGYTNVVYSTTADEQYQFRYYGGIYFANDDIAIGYEFYNAEENGYDLIDLKSNKSLANYSNMGTNDGKIYLVQTEDDKWGYIDSNGKELAIFDNAGDFYGDFAPVVKDGKAYLIDRNMNKVSEAIDGERVFAFSDGLYMVTVDGEEKFMTYAAKPTASESTSEPTNPNEPTSEPTSKPEDTKNPETGIPGIAAAVGVIALAAGTVIVAKKKK
ncbi:MAG: WG repeat-containing protein [Ruminococcaceae bacterium]|nr:WG repeat-containing protein [Oscillospiraceae bacterium]